MQVRGGGCAIKNFKATGGVAPASTTAEVTCHFKGGGGAETAAIADGLVSNPVIGFSLYTLKTAGCGLPPGPGRLLGGLEGVSYLAVAGSVGWSLYTEAKMGTGLPNGPFGLLAAVEGVPYPTVLAILLVFGLRFLERGYLPGPLPATNASAEPRPRASSSTANSQVTCKFQR